MRYALPWRRGAEIMGLMMPIYGSLKPENIVLPPATRVVIDGVESRPMLNGKVGEVTSVDPAAGRYDVQLPDERLHHVGLRAREPRHVHRFGSNARHDCDGHLLHASAERSGGRHAVNPYQGTVVQLSNLCEHLCGCAPAPLSPPLCFESAKFRNHLSHDVLGMRSMHIFARG